MVLVTSPQVLVLLKGAMLKQAFQPKAAQLSNESCAAIGLKGLCDADVAAVRRDPGSVQWCW